MSIMVTHDGLDYDQVHRDDDIDVDDGGNDELDDESIQNTILEKAPPSEKYSFFYYLSISTFIFTQSILIALYCTKPGLSCENHFRVRNTL